MPKELDENDPNWMWKRNVVDKYKTLTTEEIKTDLNKNSLPCAILAQNIQGDFNLGAILRAANFFGITKFFYYGKKRFDSRSAVGTVHYTDAINLSSIEEVQKLKEHYVFVGMENNIPGVVSMKNFIWPKNALMVFGEEGMGINDSVMNLCDHLIELPGQGSVRSLNVGCAASISMWDYISKF